MSCWRRAVFRVITRNIIRALWRVGVVGFNNFCQHYNFDWVWVLIFALDSWRGSDWKSSHWKDSLSKAVHLNIGFGHFGFVLLFLSDLVSSVLYCWFFRWLFLRFFSIGPFGVLDSSEGSILRWARFFGGLDSSVGSILRLFLWSIWQVDWLLFGSWFVFGSFKE